MINIKNVKRCIKIALKRLADVCLSPIPREYIGKILVYCYSSKYKLLIFSNDATNIQVFDLIRKSKKRVGAFLLNKDVYSVFDLIRKIKKETKMLLADQEAYLIYSTVKKLEKIEGDVAEVGTYKGGSAKLICEATKKQVHLFDTFEGLPELSEEEKEQNLFQKGQYASSFKNVKTYLKNYSDVHLYKGLFPLTAEPIKNKKFSFVHLDVDIYESTMNCLKFFYPRMSRGGGIISHDYPTSNGVKKAFDEFFKDKPEVIIELIGTKQCLVIKV